MIGIDCLLLEVLEWLGVAVAGGGLLRWLRHSTLGGVDEGGNSGVLFRSRHPVILKSGRFLIPKPVFIGSELSFTAGTTRLPRSLRVKLTLSTNCSTPIRKLTVLLTGA
jgi:hypothetical protein